MRSITQSPFRNFILGSFLGAVIVASLFTWRATYAAAAEPEPQKPCAQAGGQPISQQAWDSTLRVIRQEHETIERLNAELAEAKANPAAQLLAQSGHVMNEEQCRTWIETGSALPSVSTVLYESGRATVNVSLLPLPGAPRVSIGPNSQLAPRWIIAGKIQPQMVGETRKAIYYYFDSNSSQWQGPFAPQRVVQ